MCHYGQNDKGPSKSDIRGTPNTTFPSSFVKFFGQLFDPSQAQFPHQEHRDNEICFARLP